MNEVSVVGYLLRTRAPILPQVFYDLQRARWSASPVPWHLIVLATLPMTWHLPPPTSIPFSWYFLYLLFSALYAAMCIKITLTSFSDANSSDLSRAIKSMQSTSTLDI